MYIYYKYFKWTAWLWFNCFKLCVACGLANCNLNYLPQYRSLQTAENRVGSSLLSVAVLVFFISLEMCVVNEQCTMTHYSLLYDESQQTEISMSPMRCSCTHYMGVSVFIQIEGCVASSLLAVYRNKLNEPCPWIDCSIVVLARGTIWSLHRLYSTPTPSVNCEVCICCRMWECVDMHFRCCYSLHSIGLSYKISSRKFSVNQ